MADQRSDDISVVGRDARIEGTLTSAGSLRIHGRLTGAITVEGEVSVAAGSEKGVRWVRVSSGEGSWYRMGGNVSSSMLAIR